MRSFCKRRRDTLFIDSLRSSYNNHTFDEIFSRRGFRTNNRPAFAFIVFDRIANTRVVTKRYVKIFKDEIEGSSLIFKKIREISEEETANSAQVNPCESFHLVIHIGYEDRQEDRFIRRFPIDSRYGRTNNWETILRGPGESS